ncbi:MAG: glycosyltransferase family 1 protein, partial [Patescibacteria group bacterium]
MTIGIDARMFGAGQTGIGVYIENLIVNLIKIGKEFDFVVFANENNPELARLEKLLKAEKNFKIVLVNSHWYSWKEQLIFPFQIARQKIDLVHFPHFNIPILYRGKFIATIHDLTPKYFPGHKAGKSFLRRLAFDFVFKNALRRSEKIIAVSEYTKREILKFYEVSPDKIYVVHEGNPFQERNLKISEQAAAELKLKYGISKPFIFYTGVWRNHKNLVGLIRAFKILTERSKFDLSLVIGGKEDSCYPEVRKSWEELELSDKIILPGFISEKELPIFYKTASLTAVPSFLEGFGFIGLEAMSCGTPVAASAAGSLPEIFGKAAIYFDPKNPEDMAAAMAKILGDSAFRGSLVKN